MIGIEDLNVKGMLANEKLARSIADMGFHEFRRQLVYKVKMHGGIVVAAPRFYPSSKTCSDCGHVVPALPLSVREWTCPACGVVHDRDFNAAVNLERLAVSSTVSACGAGSSGDGLAPDVKLPAAKQELSHGLFAHV